MRLPNLLYGLFLSFLLAFNATTFAQEKNTGEVFDPIKANKFIDSLSIQLSIVTPSYEVLDGAVKKLLNRKDLAEQCVAKADAEIVSLDSQKPGTDNQGQGSIEKYVASKKADIEKRRSDCQLVVLRTSEAIAVFSEKAKQLATTELLEADSSVLDNILRLKSNGELIYKKFNFNLFYKQTGISNFTIYNSIYLLLFMIIGYFTGLRLRKIIQRRIKKLAEKPENVPSLLSQAILCVLEKHEIYIIQSFFIAAYFSITSLGMSLKPIGVTLSLVVIGYIFYISIIRFLFSPPPPSKAIINIAPEIEKPLMARLKTLGFVLSLAYVIYESLLGQRLPDETLQLPITIFITILTFNLMSILWLVNRIKKIRARFHGLRIFINILLSTILIGILIANWIGLSQLSIYLLSGIALSVISFTGYIIINKVLNYIIFRLSGTEKHWQRNLRKNLGLKQTATIPELLWIRVVIHVALWAGLVLLLLKIWRLSSADYQIFVSALFDGFNIGNIEIVPVRILFSLLCFAALIILTRWVKTYIIRKNIGSETNKGTVLAFATMFGYVGFISAFFFTLIIAGINFSGLTIIFGALSVGIGFGLQNIVNNFVSGLILLIERPIKVGDRIRVSGIEGHVININIRSTQVRSVEQYDVIVPNSELISASVTNLMFGDDVGRISIYVGVKYGSDMQLVRKTLAKAAEEHEDVITDTVDVLMTGFGDNSVNFELRAIVINVDRHISIRSDLYFAVEKGLNEAGITIPFPQRDLHFMTSFKDNKVKPVKKIIKSEKEYADEPKPPGLEELDPETT